MPKVQSKPALTLEQVQTHFQYWRETRLYRTERIPDDLLAEAVSLMGRYPLADILHKLALNRQRLLDAAASKPMVADEGKLNEPDSSSGSFVQIPYSPFDKPSSQLEFVHPNGMTLRLQDCTEALATQMLKSFMEHTPCCK